MARAKKKAVKKAKPAQKKKTTKTKAKPAKQAKAKAKAKAKPAKAKAKPGGTKTATAAAPAAAPAGVEAEVARLLADYDDGQIDNAWDVLPTMMELDEKLSKTSALRPPFDKMLGEIETICRESAGG